jgi:membrane-anchored protein YejM (alkaline phosphatase superfamily)
MGPNVPPYHPLQVEPDNDDPQAVEFAKYQSAVNFVDSLVGTVLDDLQQRDLLDRTVVLISSDHGEEFGESGEKLEKHGSGYTRFQLVTPLIVAWPGRPAGVSYDHRTSHYDIVPTLMQELFGCSNPAADYSIGTNLFDQQPWDWMLAGSYYNYAVLEPDQVTITFPNGLFEVRDWDYRLSRVPKFRGDVLEAVAEQNARFYQD